MSAPPAPMKRATTRRLNKLDDSGQEVVKPGCYTGIISKRPCCFCWSIFVAVLIVGVIPTLLGRITITPTAFASLDTPTIPEQADFLSFAYGVTNDEGFSTGGGTTDAAAAISMSTVFLYESLEDAGLFSAASVNAMATLEGAFYGSQIFSGNCVPTRNTFNASDLACASPSTILNVLYRNDALHEQDCVAGWCAVLNFIPPTALRQFCPTFGEYPCTSTRFDWRDGVLAAESDWQNLVYEKLCIPSQSSAMAQSMGLTGAYLAWGAFQRQFLLPRAYSCADPASLGALNFARSMYTMLTAYNQTVEAFHNANTGDVTAAVDAMDAAVDAVSATKSGFGPHATKPKDGKNLNVVYGPLVGSWIDPTSQAIQRLLFTDLTLAGISILLVMAVLGINTGSSLLMFVGIFEVVWSIALATFAWMVIAQDTLSTMEMLSIFVILCIGADDIFVFIDTWKESQFQPAAISGELTTRFVWTFGRAASAMLTTTATTVVTLLLNAISPFKFIQSFGVFTMFVVLFDYMLVLTLFASTTLALATISSQMCPPGQNWECSCCCPGKEGQSAPQERASSACMKNKFAPCLYKLRWVLPVITTLCAVGGFVIVFSLFEQADARDFPDQHPLTRFGVIQNENFGATEDVKMQSVVLYGMQTSSPLTYPSSVNFFNNQQEGYTSTFVPNYDGAFAFGPTEQLKIVADCDAFAADTTIVPNSESYCVLKALRDSNPGAFPYASETELRVALEAFYATPQYMALQASFSGYSYLTGFVTDSSGGIKAMWNSFNMTMPTGLKPTAVQPYYDDWVTARDATCTSVAPCVVTGHDALFYLTPTLAKISSTGVENIFLAVVVAYVILVVATENVLVPFLAVLSIASTIVWTLAMVFILGHKFDRNSAILSVMVVGLAVDYAVHITHFYNEAPGTRYEKAQDALHGVGVSVIGGAVTTGGAAAPLFFAPNFMFFQMAGAFIFFTALFGVLFSFFQLTPLLMALGPTGETGDIRAMWRFVKGKVQGTGQVPKSSPSVTSTKEASAAKPPEETAEDV